MGIKSTIRPIHSRYGDWSITVQKPTGILRRHFAVGARQRAENVLRVLEQHYDYLALPYDGAEVTIRQGQIEREILRAGGFQA